MESRLLSPGSLFADRFEIQRVAGSGGMGTVYRALDRLSDRSDGNPVALKLLNDDTSGPREAERFAREGQLLAELHHPNIVEYVAHGQAPDGQLFLAMEWLEGEDLGQRLARGRLPLQDCLRLVEQVADALCVAHQRGIIHRDLKPTNLFLLHGGAERVKVLDFGVARRITAAATMTRTGMVVGTPAYMAPEQARGCRELTPAADLFSLGCVLYECLTGQPPFIADHIAAVLVQVLFDEPVPAEHRRPGVPPVLSGVLGRLLAKDPTQRTAAAAVLRAELADLGPLPEPEHAATLPSPRATIESFAEQEQSLFSIVLAAPADDREPGTEPDTEPSTEAAVSPSAEPPGSAERQALLHAIVALGGAPDFLANGTLVVTVPPLGSAQDQAMLAARSALLIKERWPTAVVSMATGRGRVRGRTAVGEVVDHAARFLKSGSQTPARRATSGVFIDPLSAKLLEGRFAQAPTPEGALLLYEERGFDASRPLLGKPTPCVGREPELALLAAQLAACVEDSEARVTLVTAAPGIGKSRLRHEFLLRTGAQPGSRTVLLGRADILDAGAPYGLLAAVIRQLCELSAGDSLSEQRERLRARVARYVAPNDQERVVSFLGELCKVPFPDEGLPRLQAARQDPRLMRDCLRRGALDWLAAECAAGPVLLVLDDLQWGDALTLSLLDMALREQSGRPLFVLGFARPGVHDTFPTLWRGHRLQEIALKGLGKKACERLIRQVLDPAPAQDVLARVIEQSAGNALFLEELLRALNEGKVEDGPETVLAMLQSRLGQLAPGPRRSVLAASLYGQTFWRRGVAEILGMHSPESKNESENESKIGRWLDALVQHEVISPRSVSSLANQQEYTFRHGLMREAAYSLLSETDRTTGHRVAGAFLEAAGEPSAVRLAEHALHAQDLPRAVCLYARAAAQALHQGDFQGALLNAERGLRCGAQGTERGTLRAVQSLASLWTNGWQAAFDQGTEALDLLPAGSLWWCRAIYSMFSVAGSLSDPGQMPRLVERYAAAQPNEDAIEHYMNAAGSLIGNFGLLGNREAGRLFLERVRASEQRLDPARQMSLGMLHCSVGYYLHVMEPDPWAAWTSLTRSVEVLSQAGDQRNLGLAQIFLALAQSDLGAAPEGIQTLLGALQSGLRDHDALTVTLAKSYLGWIQIVLADSACGPEAEGYALELCSDQRNSLIGLAYGTRAGACWRRGQHADAEALAGQSVAAFSMMGPFKIAAMTLLARILLSTGQPARAAETSAAGLQQLQRMGGAGFSEVPLYVAAAEALLAIGDPDGARAALREATTQIQLRADRIPDPRWRSSYLSRVPAVVKAPRLSASLRIGAEV